MTDTQWIQKFFHFYALQHLYLKVIFKLEINIPFSGLFSRNSIAFFFFNQKKSSSQ